MLLDPSQLLISAKSDSRSLPPVKKTSERDREYLRPKEVEATISAAKKIGNLHLDAEERGYHSLWVEKYEYNLQGELYQNLEWLAPLLTARNLTRWLD